MKPLNRESTPIDKTICARDFMTKKVWTLRPDADVFDAIALLVEKRISGIPVLDDEKNLLGVFSEKSCMGFLVTGAYQRLPSTRVSGFMRTGVPTISEETDLLAVAQIFLNTPARRLPVLSEDNKLLGIVTRRDVLRTMLAKITVSPEELPALYLSALDGDRKRGVVNTGKS